MELSFDASHTHLFPGHQGVVRGMKSALQTGQRCDCIVEFTDGAAAVGTVEALSDGDLQLDVGAYKTAAGTAIPEKSWRVHVTPDHDGKARFKVVGKKSPGG